MNEDGHDDGTVGGNPFQDLVRQHGSPRTSVEVARELQLLAAVLFVEARRARTGAGALGHASQVLAEAPLHVVDAWPSMLLPLVQEAQQATEDALELLRIERMSGAGVVAVVEARLVELVVELAPGP